MLNYSSFFSSLDLILLNCSNCLVMCDREALKGVSIYTLKNPIRYKESKVKIVIKVNLFGLSEARSMR